MSGLIRSLASALSASYRAKKTEQTQQTFLDSIVKSLKESEVSKTHDLAVEKVELGINFRLAQSMMKFDIGATNQTGSPSARVTPSDSWSADHLTDLAMDDFIELTKSDVGLAGRTLDAAVKRHEKKFGSLADSFTYSIVLPLPMKADKDAHAE